MKLGEKPCVVLITKVGCVWGVGWDRDSLTFIPNEPALPFVLFSVLICPAIEQGLKVIWSPFECLFCLYRPFIDPLLTLY